MSPYLGLASALCLECSCQSRAFLLFFPLDSAPTVIFFLKFSDLFLVTLNLLYLPLWCFVYNSFSPGYLSPGVWLLPKTVDSEGQILFILMCPLPSTVPGTEQALRRGLLTEDDATGHWDGAVERVLSGCLHRTLHVCALGLSSGSLPAEWKDREVRA